MVTNNVSVVTNDNSDDSTFVVTNNVSVVTNNNSDDPTGEPQRVMYLFPEIDTKQKALCFRPARAVVWLNRLWKQGFSKLTLLAVSRFASPALFPLTSVSHIFDGGSLCHLL